MYKPNGEERMTVHEERLRREAITARRLERMSERRSAEALCSPIYESILGSPDPRENPIVLSFGEAR